MKIIDALNILELSNETITLIDVKKAYRKALKIYHPDINPAGHIMAQAINGAYEALKDLDYPISKTVEESFTNYGSALNDALKEIVFLVGLEIEVCMSWIWVSGNTKPHKDKLKESGFKYSGNKKMWYFRPESSKRRYFRGSTSIDEIRNKYGSVKVKFRPTQAIGARL